MKHKNVRLLVVTGGPAVVKAAMNSGKRAIAAGPGNPPAVVDETAHLDAGGAATSSTARRWTTTSSASSRRKSSRWPPSPIELKAADGEAPAPSR